MLSPRHFQLSPPLRLSRDAITPLFFAYAIFSPLPPALIRDFRAADIFFFFDFSLRFRFYADAAMMPLACAADADERHAIARFLPDIFAGDSPSPLLPFSPPCHYAIFRHFDIVIAFARCHFSIRCHATPFHAFAMPLSPRFRHCRLSFRFFAAFIFVFVSCTDIFTLSFSSLSRYCHLRQLSIFSLPISLCRFQLFSLSRRRHRLMPLATAIFAAAAIFSFR